MRRPFRAAAATVALVAAVVAGGCTDDGSSEEFCERLGDIADVSDILAEIDGSDPTAARAKLREGVSDYRALEAAAPGEVRADIARVRQGVELVLEAVEANPDDLPAARQQIQARSDELAGLLQAGERVVRYAAEECGLSLITGPTSDPADPTATDPSSTDPTSTDDGTSVDPSDGTGPDATTGTSLDGEG